MTGNPEEEFGTEKVKRPCPSQKSSQYDYPVVYVKCQEVDGQNIPALPRKLGLFISSAAACSWTALVALKLGCDRSSRYTLQVAPGEANNVIQIPSWDGDMDDEVLDTLVAELIQVH